MKAGDQVTIKNHPEIKGTHKVEEYSLRGRTFCHVQKIPLTSPEEEPWDILKLESKNGINCYEATWRRQTKLTIEED